MYLDHMKRRVKNNDTLLEVFAFLDRNEHGRVSREDVRQLYLIPFHMRQAITNHFLHVFSSFSFTGSCR
jgi:Ca2+-binding EF-hand superfamily protein